MPPPSTSTSSSPSPQPPPPPSQARHRCRRPLHVTDNPRPHRRCHRPAQAEDSGDLLARGRGNSVIVGGGNVVGNGNGDSSSDLPFFCSHLQLALLELLLRLHRGRGLDLRVVRAVAGAVRRREDGTVARRVAGGGARRVVDGSCRRVLLRRVQGRLDRVSFVCWSFKGVRGEERSELEEARKRGKKTSLFFA